VGEYYNKNFINYKFDMEKGEGPEFASKYRVTAYPTLLYLTSDGKVLHRVMGAKQPEGFINEGRKAIVVNEYK
jgi:thioredoxin-related protein